MRSPRPHPPTPAPLRPNGGTAGGLPGLQRDTLASLVGVGVLLLLCATGLVAALNDSPGLGPAYPVKAALLYAAGAWLVWRALGADAARAPHPHPHFGAANRVTLLRLALAALLLALLGERVLQSPSSAAWWGWALVVVATLTALLDAVDGPLARRAGMASAFGARFDMETDAWFTLVLCLLVMHTGQAGPWVLASGLMRYAFIAASRGWPWLAGPLPPSRRRQTVCVVQITTLIVCLGPIVPPPLAAALAAASLALLASSFAIDIMTLARMPRRNPES